MSRWDSDLPRLRDQAALGAGQPVVHWNEAIWRPTVLSVSHNLLRCRVRSRLCWPEARLRNEQDSQGSDAANQRVGPGTEKGRRVARSVELVWTR